MAVSKGFGQFGRRMGVVAKTTLANSAKTVRKTALVMDQILVLSTPVDTGRARANWLCSLGSPSLTNDAPPSEGDGAASAAKAQAQALGAIAPWKPGGPPIFLSNGVPYIEKLDNGSSRQAPKGMSKAALQVGRAILRKARLLVE